jgi:hypothetical protein
MRRNRWILLGGSLAMLSIAILIHFALWSARPGVTGPNFARLEMGMTQSEAEEILGGPPSYTAPNGREWIGLMFLRGKVGCSTREVWGGNDATVMIYFDAQGQLVEKDRFDAEESLRTRLRRYVPWI